MKKRGENAENNIHLLMVVEGSLGKYPECNLNSDLDSDSRQIYLLCILCQGLARHVHMCSTYVYRD